LAYPEVSKPDYRTGKEMQKTQIPGNIFSLANNNYVWLLSEMKR